MTLSCITKLCFDDLKKKKRNFNFVYCRFFFHLLHTCAFLIWTQLHSAYICLRTPLCDPAPQPKTHTLLDSFWTRSSEQYSSFYMHCAPLPYGCDLHMCCLLHICPSHLDRGTPPVWFSLMFCCWGFFKQPFEVIQIKWDWLMAPPLIDITRAVIIA